VPEDIAIRLAGRKPVSTLDIDPGCSLSSGRPKAGPGGRDDEDGALLRRPKFDTFASSSRTQAKFAKVEKSVC
jgi:hypothetical protein